MKVLYQTMSVQYQEREIEKKSKYQNLTADLAKQWKGYEVRVVPVVIGDLGVIKNMRS